MHRRRFLAASAAACGFAAISKSLAEAGEQGQPKPIPIVDTHLHLWDLNRFRLPWVKKDTPLARSFVMKDYQTAIEGQNVVKAVYMEVDVAVDQLTAEAQHVLEICRQGNTPMAAAVIGGRPASDDFAKYLDQFKGNRYLKGVRQVLHSEATKPGFCLEANFQRGLRALEERGLSFDLCIRPAELPNYVKLVEAMPKMRFILDHCGNGNVQAKDLTDWRRGMERIARNENVVCKISGIVVNARPKKWTADDLAPIVNHTLQVFGPDRVMFGGDWPVCTLTSTFRQWVEALKSIVRNRPADEQRKLFHDNAMRFYGLK
ncbi:MAG: amidohydrolase family protein [Planctomycetes bacterium]|nr:amidohydrolase family protein [Planctomycetota bacterium]